MILAAGASRRMGSPKALLEAGGETFLDRMIGLVQPFCTQVIVVLAHDADRIRAGVRRPADFVVNPEPERGQLSSLQCGLRAVHPGMDAVFYTPVDFPSIRAETVKALTTAFVPGVAAIAPQHDGRHGHPVLLSAAVIPMFLAPDATTARDVLHTTAVQYIDVNDPGILRDVDTPEDYRTVAE